MLARGVKGVSGSSIFSEVFTGYASCRPVAESISRVLRKDSCLHDLQLSFASRSQIFMAEDHRKILRRT